MLRFDSIEELDEWLRGHEIDLSQWGEGAAKSVDDLWAEIAKGESVMQDEAPLRSVQAVRVVVRRDDQVLIEAYQGFNSGRRRERNRPPSEKMHPGERYVDAALRCLREELGVEAEDVRLKHETYRRKVWEGIPDSYPGLCTRYVFHVVDAHVQGLPQSDFSTIERETGPGEPIGVHYWEWRARRDGN
jgi:hypothetical protein